MTIRKRQIGRIVVLDLQGAIAGRDSADALVTAVKRLTRSGTRTVIANLAGVASIDLSGLGALLDASQALRAVDGSLTLTAVTRRINDFLVITRLLTVFETYDTVKDAVSAIAGVGRGQEDVTSAATLGTITRFLRRAHAR